MDTTDPNIFFDTNGYCNHCSSALARIENYSNQQKNQANLKRIISLARTEGKEKQYDCLIGLSGGIDSSYLAYTLVKDYGLRPLAIHVDNGWNSEIAVSNIHNIVTKLNIDLYTHVINWNEFKELQKAFLRASVVDLEMLSDHAIVVVINKVAREKKIKYFLIGANYQTESILPRNWYNTYKRDSRNIVDIYNQFGKGTKLQTYPLLSFYRYMFFDRKYGKYLNPLFYMKYNKAASKKLLQKELNWEDYGMKHGESFITEFYQNYILPTKFEIDKRKAHLSSLICSNQITREEALMQLEKPTYSAEHEKHAIEFFLKKMGFSEQEFSEVMSLPRREHSEFKSFVHKKEAVLRALKTVTLKR